MSNRRAFITSLPVVFAMALAPLLAQDYRAKVSGTVTDSSGGLIVNATATLKNVETGVVAVRQSNATGQYRFDLVVPGTYSVSVSQPGFKRFVRENVVVQARGDVTVDAVLSPGEVTAEVTVVSAVPQVEFTTATMSMMVDRKMLNDIPVQYRSPFTLAQLDPLVRSTHWDVPTPYDMYTATNLNVAGGTAQKNELQMDGAPLMVGNGKASYTPPMDAVQEVAVQQNAVDVEFGFNAGGVMSVATRSGTNEYHGSAYYFGRNPALNSRPSPMSNPASENKQHNHIWGGALGNPIKKNKLFTFNAWEQWKTVEPHFPMSTWTLPTAAERTGDFSKTLWYNSGTGETGQKVIYDPWSATLSGNNFVRTPFAGNRIPDQRIDSTAKAFLQDIWQPKTAGIDPSGVQNYTEVLTWQVKYWNLNHRTDFNVSDKWRVFGRYSQYHTRLTEGHDVTSRAMTNDNGGIMHTLNLGGDAVYMMSSSTILNFNVFYTSMHDNYDADYAALSRDELAKFWPSKWYEPYVEGADRLYYPYLSVGGSLFGHNRAWIHEAKTFNATAKLMFTHGAHSFKLGTGNRRFWGPQGRPSPFNFAFNSSYTANQLTSADTLKTGHSWASFLLGAMSSGSSTYALIQDLRMSDYYAYVQDDFRLNRSITLNLGVRWEYDRPPVEAKDRLQKPFDLTAPIPELANGVTMPAETLALGTVNYKYTGAYRFTSASDRGAVGTRKLVLLPRLGVAFRLNDRTALRAGWARNMWPMAEGKGPGQWAALGYTQTTSILGGLEGRPQDILRDPFPAGVNPLIPVVGKGYGAYTAMGGSLTGLSATTQDTIVLPKVDRYTVSFQRQLPLQFALDATYLYSHGYDIAYSRDLNMINPLYYYQGKAAYSASVPNPFYNLLPANKMPGGLRTSKNVSAGSLLRPYAAYGTISQVYTPELTDIYHAMRIKLNRPFAKGLSTSFAYAYTFQRSSSYFTDLDAYSHTLYFQDSSSPRHRIVGSAVWDLPVGRKRKLLPNIHPVLDAVLGGWSSSWIVTFSSGSFLTFGQMEVSGDPRVGNTNPNLWFNTAVFKQSAAYTVRTNPVQYSGLTGPTSTNIDAGFSKSFPIPIREGMKLEFKVEAYNLPNTIMLANPSTSVTSSQFGRVSSESNLGRSIQYTARLHF
jgi:hypothetical protein